MAAGGRHRERRRAHRRRGRPPGRRRRSRRTSPCGARPGWGEASVVDVGCVLTTLEHRRQGSRSSPTRSITDSRVDARAADRPVRAPATRQRDLARAPTSGNFVETKKTTLARGAKANHLAYLGDGNIGEEANVGAGTIFCNYDGFQKHTTTIGAGAFIGSDSQIVAPVTIGAGAYVATGTTVTKDVPADALAIARTRQENKEGYAPKLRARLKGEKPGPT